MSTMYQFRIDEAEKAEIFSIFAEMGIKPAQAVRLFFRQVRKTHTLPFPIERIPNAETRAAIEELESGKGHRVNSIEELMSDLHASD